MAEASKKTKQIRRLKRQRTLAMRLANQALLQRDAIGQMYQDEIAKQVVRKSKEPQVTITRVPNEQEIPDGQAHGVGTEDSVGD